MGAHQPPQTASDWEPSRVHASALTIPVALTLDEWQAVILSVALYAHHALGETEASAKMQSIQSQIYAQVVRKGRFLA